MIGTTVSHYKILEKIGGGGMGQVYKALDTRHDRRRALKFLAPELLVNDDSKKRFLREAQAASSLEHPNICTVHGVEEIDDGRLFIAMSYYEGPSLRARLSDGPLDPPEAVAIAHAIADGLAHAHARGIVHRDIKPANVILARRVKIVDFGLAKLIDRSTVTRDGMTVGTVSYMAPEQASGDAVGPATDVWALGVTLFEMITGQLPFRGEVDAAMVYSIRHEPPRDIDELRAGVPGDLKAILMRCLEKDPESRYTSAEAVMVDLRNLSRTHGWGDVAATQPVAPTDDRRRARRKLRPVLGVALAAAIVTAALMYFRPHAPGVYTTDLRVAVLPFENRIGDRYDSFVAGMFEGCSLLTHQLVREHPSAWSAPPTDVMAASVNSPGAAPPALGVNRVITGSVEPVGNGHRLALALLDAQSLDPIRTAGFGFDIMTLSGVNDSLPSAFAHLLGVPDRIRWTDSPRALRAYLEALGQRERGGHKSVQPLLALAIADDDAFGRAHLAMGELATTKLIESGDTTWAFTAVRHLSRAASLDTTDADPLVALARLYRDGMNDIDAAATAAHRAVSADSTNLRAWEVLAQVCRDQGRVDAARRAAEAVVSVRPDCWHAHQILALESYYADDLDAAIGALSDAVLLAPGNERTLIRLANMHRRNADWADAREYYERAMSATCAGERNIGAMFYNEGRFDDATRHFRAALALCDTNRHEPWGDLAGALRWIRGGAAESKRIYRKAIRLAENALARNPDDPRTLADLIEYYAMSGDEAGARGAIERARPYANADADVMCRTAAAHETFGERERALNDLREAVDLGYPLSEILSEPVFATLITDSRFAATLESADVGR